MHNVIIIVGSGPYLCRLLITDTDGFFAPESFSILPAQNCFLSFHGSMPYAASTLNVVGNVVTDISNLCGCSSDFLVTVTDDVLKSFHKSSASPGVGNQHFMTCTKNCDASSS